MTELDAEIIPLAYELCEEFGKQIEYTITGVTAYNPDTQTSEPTKTKLAHCKMFPPEDYSTFATVNSSGLIEEGDKEAYLPSQYFNDAGLEPTEEDFAEFDGDKWIVKKVEAVFSGDEIAVYKMQLRK